LGKLFILRKTAPAQSFYLFKFQVKLFQTDQLPGRTVRTEDGKDYLYFSGTDYLGMGHNEAFRSYLLEGFRLYGNHYGSSRNNSLRLAVYQEAETSFAKFTGAPSSLIVSSGIWAGQLVMKEIESITCSVGAKPGIKYYYAPKVHPALWGTQYSVSHDSWQNWTDETIALINQSKPSEVHIICTDAVGSPWAEEFDLSVFSRISNIKNTWLIVDESHALGVKGQKGSGVYKDLNAAVSVNNIVLSSLNKALGIPAGGIYADAEVLAKLKSSPWFAGASPPAPAFVFAFLKILTDGTYITAWDKLQANISYFKNKLPDSPLFTVVDDYPVFCSKRHKLFAHLLENDMMGSCFSYPSPSDTPVVRLAISALHQKEDLDRLAEVCMKFQY
jgi:8-amino-7-oxononanoate synthase